jgi:hypothetical protein
MTWASATREILGVPWKPCFFNNTRSRVVCYRPTDAFQTLCNIEMWLGTLQLECRAQTGGENSGSASVPTTRS